MAPRRTNTPSRRRPSQAIRAEREPGADSEAESSAPRAKTSHQRRSNQVTETNPEVEIENNETKSSRALIAWHNRRPSRLTEADADQEAENQPETQAQPIIPTKPPRAPRQWALYFANLVRLPFVPSFSCFSSGTDIYPSPIHSSPQNTHTYLI